MIDLQKRQRSLFKNKTRLSLEEYQRINIIQTMSDSVQVLLSTKLSVVVQIITGMLGLHGITYILPAPHGVLTKLLTVETIVQFVELSFYLFFIVRFHLASLARWRYYDWFFTTPLMLLTTVVFFKYNQIMATQPAPQNAPVPTSLSIAAVIKEHPAAVATIAAANAAMLVFGYLGETGHMSRTLASQLGFAALAVSFGTIWHVFARHARRSQVFFAFLAIFWSAYGIAYGFPVASKNISFNLLDIVAKNFFGIFLYGLILSVSRATKITPQSSAAPSPAPTPSPTLSLTPTEAEATSLLPPGPFSDQVVLPITGAGPAA